MSSSGRSERDILVEAWRASRTPLASWVRNVHTAVEASGLDLLDAAEIMGATVAELDAVARLAILDEVTLDSVSRANPSMTTWFLLTELRAEDIPAVLESAKAVGDAPTEYQRVAHAIRDLTGAADATAIQNLDPALLDFALAKARAYSQWSSNSKHYGALQSFSKRRRSGQPLTPRQTAYAKSLLQELVEADVIRTPSPDGDDELCEPILQLLR